MILLQSARDAILNSPLGIKANDLLTFAEKGTVTAARGMRNGNFNIAYTAHLIVTDYAGAPQDLFFVVLAWLHSAYPAAAPEAIKFHVDIIDHEKADVSIAVELAELIQVTTGEDGHTLDPKPGGDALAFDMQTFFPDMPDAPPE